jgi:drug/metabolite transporter (DMT)-like permease
MMTPDAPGSDGDGKAIAALLAGVTVWGVIWLPYRLLNQAGLSPVGAVLLTDLVSLAVGCVLWRRILSARLPSGLLLLIAITSGGANVGYVLGTVYGQVMRVMLLFYLAPLWTVLWARLLLGERVGRAGLPVLALSMGGAAIMLWQPESGMPWPASAADWIGLVAGLLFALSNVLVRKAGGVDVRKKSLAAFFGVVIVASALWPFDPTPVDALAALGGRSLAIVVATGLVLIAATMLVYFAISRLPANRAVVLMLFELVVAALAAWLFAGETMSARDWLGGGLIVAASLLSERIGQTG